MAIVIWNPTDERFEAQYIGEFVEILPGQKIKVDDARGKALLNTLAPRGLTSLEYGDEGDVEKRKGDKARQRNFEFKKLQVIRYNQQNEEQRQNNRPYLTPPAQIKQYALDVGIKLTEPYSFKDEEVTEISNLRKDKSDQKRYIQELEEQNKAQAAQISDLASKVDKLITMVEARAAAGAKVEVDPETKKTVDLQLIRDQLNYKNVNRLHLKGWVARNWEKIQAAPPEIQDEIHQKWIDLMNMPFPEERPEVEAA